MSLVDGLTVCLGASPPGQLVAMFNVDLSQIKQQSAKTWCNFASFTCYKEVCVLFCAIE